MPLIGLAHRSHRWPRLRHFRCFCVCTRKIILSLYMYLYDFLWHKWNVKGQLLNVLPLVQSAKYKSSINVSHIPHWTGSTIIKKITHIISLRNTLRFRADIKFFWERTSLKVYYYSMKDLTLFIIKSYE